MSYIRFMNKSSLEKYKSRNEENLLPFHIIKAASEGDVSSINTVLIHYDVYIINFST